MNAPVNIPNYFRQAESAGRCFAALVEELRSRGYEVTVWSSGEATIDVAVEPAEYGAAFRAALAKAGIKEEL